MVLWDPWPESCDIGRLKIGLRFRGEDVVGGMRRQVGAILVLVSLLAPGASVAGQEDASQRQAYFEALAEFFEIPVEEVSILGEWRLSTEEIPVALFVARRAGVSAEALVALRRAGRPWPDLVRRYQLDASHFYVPLSDLSAAGPLRAAYDAFASMPASRWGDLELGHEDIVWLVNLRVVAQTLRLPPRDVLRARGRAESWVTAYGALLRGSGGPRGGPMKGRLRL